MKKILVAYDGSEPATRAVRLAAELAGGLGAKLVVTHVIPPTVWPFEGFAAPLPEYERAEKQNAEKLLAKAGDLSGPVATETKVAYGPIAQSIAQLAEDPEVELVVLGSRGLGGVARMLIGSVTDRLVRISKKPVLVTH